MPYAKYKVKGRSIMSEFLLGIALLGTIIGGAGSIILAFKSENFALIMIPMIIGVCAITLPAMLAMESEKTLETKLILIEFDKLNCADKADLILKNYLDGNKTRTSDLIPVFTNAGCKFDITSQLVLENRN